MNQRTCYSHLTDEELLRCTRQSDDPLVDELSSRLARRLGAETRAPVFTRYVGETAEDMRRRYDDTSRRIQT